MRTAAKVDLNQKQLTADLRKLGATVQPLHIIGKGCPDLLVGYHGVNWLLEIKDGRSVPSRQKLTVDEQKWHDKWRGQVVVVRNIEDFFDLLKGSE